MLLNRIIQNVNELLDGETLSYLEMRRHLDRTIDDINQQLNSKFPVFSDLAVDQVDYNFFPDRYVRTVVCQGAAMYFYMTDEEGGQPPMGYAGAYRDALFLMLRDYISQVPAEYQDIDTAGTVAFSLSGSDYSVTGVNMGDFLP